MEIREELGNSVDGQWSLACEKLNVRRHYKILVPVKGEDGLWMIGG